MFSLRYVKFEPNSYAILYKNGQIVKQGSGLNFWYFADTSSVAKIPTDVADESFMFDDNTQDYQNITIQGSISYRISEPLKAAEYLNFTLTPNRRSYVSAPIDMLLKKINNAVIVSANKVIGKMELKKAITSREYIKDMILLDLRQNEELAQMGIEIINLSLLAVRPNADTARALEAQVREQILKDSDDAIYNRRNSSIEQERLVKENEYNTQIAVEEKKREIEERKLMAKQGLQKQQNQLKNRLTLI